MLFFVSLLLPLPWFSVQHKFDNIHKYARGNQVICHTLELQDRLNKINNHG